MDLENFKKLKLQADKDLMLDENNAGEKSLKFAGIYNRYLELYIQELRILKTIDLNRDKLYGELYHNFKFKNNYKLDNKGEIDVYVRADEKYYNMSLEYQNTEMVVKYLESVLSNINNSRYSIKNYIEMVKIKMGIR